MKYHPAGIPLLIAGWLIAAPAFAQMDRPVPRFEPVYTQQDNSEDDATDEEEAESTAPLIQVAPETLRNMRRMDPPPAQIAPQRQEESSTLPNLQMPAFRPFQEPASWHMSSARITGARNEQRAVPNDQRFLGPVAALNAFSLRFENGDHKIRRMAVLAEDRFVRFSFADQDSNDPFEATARWLVISRGQQYETSGNGGGTFHLPLQAGPPGHTAVLTGFNIQRQGGTDANVRSFGIWLEDDEDGNAVVRVSLLDDMGQDFRGFAEAVFAGMAASLIPTVEIVASHAVAVDGLSRFGAQGGPRPYAATIQYAWIPDSLIVREGAAAGGNDRQFNPLQPIALQGFFLHFDNEDHHLLEVGVDAGSQRGIRYRDNNWDDPVRWEVQYVVINDEMRD